MAKASGSIDIKGLKVAGEGASKYLTYIDGTSGISVHDVNDTSNFVNMNSNGVEVYKNGARVGSFGEEITLGTESNGYVNINAGGFGIYSSEAQLAAFNTGGIVLNAENGDPAITIATSGETIQKTITTQLKTWYEVPAKSLEPLESDNILVTLGTFKASSVKVNIGAPRLDKNSTATLSAITITKPSSTTPTRVHIGGDQYSLALYTEVDAYLTFYRTGKLQLQIHVHNDDQTTGTHQTVYMYLNTISYTETVDVPSIKCDGTITVLDHDTPIGTVMRDSFSKSIASGTTLTAMGLNKSMSAGSWVVNYSMRFPSNNTGRRGAAIGINGSNMASGYTLSPPVNGEVTALTGSTVTQQDSDWTLDFFARQNSGSAQTVTVHYDIIRIA